MTAETLLQIDELIDDIKSCRDVRPDSVVRALTDLVKEVRECHELLADVGRLEVEAR